MEKISSDRLQQLLIENSTTKFYIQHNFADEIFGLFNHMSQGIIALSRLGASEQYIYRFIENYQRQLDPSEPYRAKSTDIKSEEVATGMFLGKHKHFYPIVDYYESLLTKSYAGDVRKLLAVEFDKVAVGMICVAMHGPIHIGYGLVAGNSRMVCEGLALLHHSYLPIEGEKSAMEKPLGRGTRNILDILAALKKDQELQQRIKEEMKNPKYDMWSARDFHKRIAIMASDRADHLLKYVNDIKIPVGLLGEKGEDCRELLRWIFEIALMVYATTEPRNNFYILHGVTSSWGLLQMVSCLDDLLSWQQIHRYVKFYLFGVLAIFAEDPPRLNHDLIDEGKTSVETRSWQDIIDDLMKDIGTDEHLIKMVQICRERDVGDDGKSESRKSNFYKLAATTASKYPFYYGEEGAPPRTFRS